MKNVRLLHAVHLTLESPGQIAGALRAARACREASGEDYPVLFFCDLPDAPAGATPEDAELIRCVQSGVMSMEARRPGKYAFLVRKRKRNDVLRMHLGAGQSRDLRPALHALLTGGQLPSAEASSVRPGEYAGKFDAVLITDASLRFLPDVPARLLAQFSPEKTLFIRARYPSREEEPLFAGLMRAGFSPVPPLAGECAEAPPALLCPAGALLSHTTAEEARSFTMLQSELPSPDSLLDQAYRAFALGPIRAPLLILLRAALLFAAALTGQNFAAWAAVLLWELPVLLSPRQIPCALVRTALFPRLTLCAANALLARRMRGRFCLSFSCGPMSGVLFGAALLAFSVRSAGALVPLLPVCLLFFASPLITRALSLPPSLRIPLSADEKSRLRALCRGAFDALPESGSLPSHMLCACAGCMLGLLEADEAARRAQAMLPRLSIQTAFDAACLFSAAQFFQERMAECDAALRDLPAQIETLAARYNPNPEDGFLAALIACAKNGAVLPSALPRGAGETDALFLPRAFARGDAMLPFTHPHTFLLAAEKEGHEKSGPPSEPEAASRFLILFCTLRGETFCSLLLRSGRLLPYAPLMDLPDQQTAKPASRSAATIRLA